MGNNDPIEPASAPRKHHRTIETGTFLTGNIHGHDHVVPLVSFLDEPRGHFRMSQFQYLALSAHRGSFSTSCRDQGAQHAAYRFVTVHVRFFVGYSKNFCECRLFLKKNFCERRPFLKGNFCDKNKKPWSLYTKFYSFFPSSLGLMVRHWSLLSKDIGSSPIDCEGGLV